MLVQLNVVRITIQNIIKRKQILRKDKIKFINQIIKLIFILHFIE